MRRNVLLLTVIFAGLVIQVPSFAADEKPVARSVPFTVAYEFKKQSEIRDPKLVHITRLEVGWRHGSLWLLISLVNNNKQPVSAKGTIRFYDEHDAVIDVSRDVDLAYQADPGTFKQSMELGLFKQKDLPRIHHAQITIEELGHWSYENQGD